MKKTIFTILMMALCSLILIGQTKRTIRKQSHKKARTQSKQKAAQKKKLLEQTVLSKIDDEEYLLFSELWNGSADYSRVIINETIPAQVTNGNESKYDLKDAFRGSVNANYLKETIAGLSDETVKDFNQKNNKAYLLERKFPLKSKYELLSNDEINRFFYEARNLEKGWKDFKEKYPESGAYVQFSRIGVNVDKTQAIIYFTYSCGSLCASGDFIFYVKENDKWIEKGKVNLWVS